MKANFYQLIHKNLNNHVTTEQERKISANLTRLASYTPEQVIQQLNSSVKGLTKRQVTERLRENGPNIIVHNKLKPWYLQFLLAFNNPFNYVLFVLAVVSIFTRDITGTSIILFMIMLSVIIKFTQEYKSGKSAQNLKALVHTTCAALRTADNGEAAVEETPMEKIVPGDIIQLAAGDIIPADVRVLHSKNLYISQSALTGESLPVEKGDIATTTDNVLELKNICFMGTNVETGSATAIVVATGAGTYFGDMAKSLTGAKQPTSFDIGINNVSWLLIKFMLVMAPVVFFLTGFTKGNWLDALLFALSVTVGLTPEMLPVVVTSNLTKGAIRMARAKVVVKKLKAIQNFGAMNILCTDKTGTLTQDKIIIVKHLDMFGRESQQVLEYAYLNSHFQSGLKNAMDMTILDNQDVLDAKELVEQWQVVDELPFDFVRRKMSIIIQKPNKNPIMICKGAVEEMIASAGYVSVEGGVKPVDGAIKAQIMQNAANLNEDGLRVIAVGHREFGLEHGRPYTTNDEYELTLDGFVAFLDPPKETAKTALDALQSNGIRVLVLTGDNAIIAGKVCRDVGLSAQRVLTGGDIENLSDDEAIKLINDHQVIARLTPMQKSRIVDLLRKQGNVVGYMGDGINDAMSLRDADIGISVDTAVDIAKESADMILMEKNLLVLNQGVIEGRKTFANTMKYIKITASSNFGNVFSLLGASVLFPFLPMLPLQILILNLLYDISQISLPWDNVDKEYLAKPRKWVSSDIKRFMLIMGPSSSIFDYATFAVLFFIVGASTVEQQAIFQSGWFIESLFTQTLVVQVFRTEKIPFLQSRPSAPVFITAILLLTLGFLLPHTGVGKAIGFTILPSIFYGWLAAILAGYIILAQLLKTWYIKRFHSWL